MVPPCEHVRPQTLSADDTVVGYSEQAPMETPLGKPEAVFHDSIPDENGVGLRFRAEFFNLFNHANFGSPNNTLTSPVPRQNDFRNNVTAAKLNDMASSPMKFLYRDSKLFCRF